MLDYLNKWTIARKLPFLIIGAALLSTASVGGLNYFQAAEELRTAATEKLTALAAARKAALSDYLQAIRSDLLVVASNTMVADALTQFSTAFRTLNTVTGNAEAALQKLYIDDNPNPTGEKHKLDQAPDRSVYSVLHGRHHPWFRQMLEERGYYDLFLIAPDGNLVYSVFKERDYATNLETGPWRDSDLAKVFREVRDDSRLGALSFADFRPYGPSAGSPAGFIAAPVLRDGNLLGVLAFQIPIDRINRVMQVAAGMGETGDTYLVGRDYLMRSDSRLSKEPTILKRRVESASVKAALAGESGVREIVNDADVPVLSVHQPIDFEGVRWAVLAEAETDEIFAAAAEMRDFALIIGICALAVVGVLGVLVVRGITKPLTAMTTAMRALAGGDQGIAVPGLDRRDEVGAMASAVQVFKDNAIAGAVEEQGAATQEIARNVQQAAAGTRDVSGNIAGVSSAAGETGAAAGRMLAASGQLTEQSGRLSREVEKFLQQVRTA